jgi:hypothetical protein
MNFEEIIEMARKAGGCDSTSNGLTSWDGTQSIEFLERFVELIAAEAAAKEREACAKVCDELPAPDFYTDACAGMGDITTSRCGDAIRARGEA